MKIIFYHNNCPMCLLIEQELKRKNLQYEESTDIQKILDLGFETVPILQIDDKFYVGGSNCLKILQELN